MFKIKLFFLLILQLGTLSKINSEILFKLLSITDKEIILCISDLQMSLDVKLLNAIYHKFKKIKLVL